MWFMSFIDLLRNVGMMLIWWVGGVIGILIGLYLSWLSIPNPNINWFLLIISLIIIGISVLAIAYGTNKHDREL